LFRDYPGEPVPGKNNLDFTEARDSECQIANHTSTSSLIFNRLDALPAAPLANSVKALKAIRQGTVDENLKEMGMD